MSISLAEKCARARALMEEAQQLVDEVLDDPGYKAASEDPAVWPRGVIPEGVPDYLPDAIRMLTPEPEGWGEDEPSKVRPQLRIVASQ